MSITLFENISQAENKDQTEKKNTQTNNENSFADDLFFQRTMIFFLNIYQDRLGLVVVENMQHYIQIRLPLNHLRPHTINTQLNIQLHRK